MKQFHGQQTKGAFFEGWYLRQQNGRDTIAVIPAFHRDARGCASASIQVISDEGSWNIPFSAQDFHADAESFCVRLGKNFFRPSGLCLDLEGPGLRLEGSLRYGPFTPPQGDVMGPFRFLPGMECCHGVLSLSHRVEGRLILNGRNLDFFPGTGYLEKDWGSSFPQAYLWTQCNRFGPVDCSIFAAAARIPLTGKVAFPGCIACVRLGGREYRLATYRGGRVEVMSPRSLLLRQGDQLLRADLLEGRPLPLLAPALGGMTRTIHESAACRVRYRFRKGGRLLLDLTSRQAGFEWSRS